MNTGEAGRYSSYLAAMKLQIVRETGETETIFLTGRWEIVEGSHLHRMRHESGLEYYFTPSGRYDGWGTAGVADPKAAKAIIDAMKGQQSPNGN